MNTQETPVLEAPLQITPAKDIKSRAREVMVEGKLVKLPSGIVVRLARPSLARMIKDGRIPDHLISVAVKQLQGSTAMTAKEVQDSIKVMEEIMMAGFVEPKLVLEVTGDNEITINDIDDDDRAAAYNYIQFGDEKSRGGLNDFRK